MREVKKMDSDKEEAIQRLIEVFARDFTKRNHVILVDMTTGSYRVDEMLAQEIVQKPMMSALPETHDEV